MLKNKKSIGENPAKEGRRGLYGFFSRCFRKVDGLFMDNKKAFIFLICYSAVFNILLEMTLRKNVFKGLGIIFTSPIVYLLGTLIVFATLCCSFLFKRRTFVFSLVSFIWFLILVVNFALMIIFRAGGTPFSYNDIEVFLSTKDILNNGYIGVFEIILIIIALILLLALIVFIYFKCTKYSGKSKLLSFVSVQVCAAAILCSIGYSAAFIGDTKFDNPLNDFRKHGYAYCFFYSIVDRGIDEPDDYDSDKLSDTALDTKNKDKKLPSSEQHISAVNNADFIDSIYNQVVLGYEDMAKHPVTLVTVEKANAQIASLKEKYEKHVEVSAISSAVNSDNPGNSSTGFPSQFDKPNVIFLQLESFYDVNNIQGYEYSKEPHPIYSSLKELLPHGKLTVPSIGAGTANTEFEVITGMDVSLFGITEVPYLSVLKEQTCESICYNAKEYGYSTHAIHNNRGNFYGRNEAFRNLGFDTFTSLETMIGVDTNPVNNWCKDRELIDPLFKTLASTEGKDLIYTISVQPHGNYPDEDTYNGMLMGKKPHVEVTGNEDNPENPGFTYYVNQLNEVDTFIGELILELNFLSEPTVLVMYGDHLPAFSIEEYWTLKEGNCYQTDYIIWNNCGIDFSDAQDFESYQLSSYIFSKLGINEGVINTHHRYYLKKEPEIGDKENYAKKLHEYQYGIFSDETFKEQTNSSPFKNYLPVETQYGIENADILSVHTIGEETFIRGTRFNKDFTKILINGNPVETVFYNSGTVSTLEYIKPGDIITTAQMSSAALGKSNNAKIYSESMIVPKKLEKEALAEILPEGRPTETE